MSDDKPKRNRETVIVGDDGGEGDVGVGADGGAPGERDTVGAGKPVGERPPPVPPPPRRSFRDTVLPGFLRDLMAAENDRKSVPPRPLRSSRETVLPEFLRGDPKKPQLSQTAHAPMTSAQRRASSDVLEPPYDLVGQRGTQAAPDSGPPTSAPPAEPPRPPASAAPRKGPVAESDEDLSWLDDAETFDQLAPVSKAALDEVGMQRGGAATTNVPSPAGRAGRPGPGPGAKHARRAAHGPTTAERPRAAGVDPDAETREEPLPTSDYGEEDEDGGGEFVLHSGKGEGGFAIGLLIGVGMIGLASVFPASIQDSFPLWQGLTRGAEVAFPSLLVLSLVATALAGLAGLAGLFGGGFRQTADVAAAPSAWMAILIPAVVLGVLARLGADPTLSVSMMAPMRYGLFGIPTLLWASVAAGGVLAMTASPAHRASRALAAIGVLGLFLETWMPIGWLGSAQLPLIAALRAVGDGTTSDLPAMVTGPVMAGPAGTVLLSLISVALVVVVLVPRRLPVWPVRALGIAALAVPILWLASAGSEDAQTVTQGVALQVGGLAVLLAMGLAASAQRVGAEVDHISAVRLERIGFLFIIGTFILLKTNGLRWSTTDEGIYFYAAKRWAEGVWPYHDYFFSHPPLHIALPAMIFGVGGFHFTLAKWIPAVATLISGLVIMRLSRRATSRLGGLVALMLFLFAGEVLKASTNMTGINLTTMWVTFGLAAALRRRAFLAGIFFGSAAATGFYSIGFAVAFAFIGLFAPPADEDNPPRTIAEHLVSHFTSRLVIGFLIVWGSVNVLGYLLAHEDFINGVYRYHLIKAAKTVGFIPVSEGGPTAALSNFSLWFGSRDLLVHFYYHAAHWILAFLALVGVVLGIVHQRAAYAHARDLLQKKLGEQGRKKARSRDDAPRLPAQASWRLLWDPRLWWRHRRDGGVTLISAAVLVAIAIEFAQFRERYDFYYTLMLPLLAVLGASAVHSLLRLGLTAVGAGWFWHRPAWLPARVEGDPRNDRPPAWLTATVVAAVLASFLWVPLDLSANQKAFPSEAIARGNSKGLGERLDFVWTPAPGPELVSEMTQGLAWRPSRVRGNIELGAHHYLWSKKRYFSTAPEIAAYVRHHSELSETLTGSSLHAPTVALLAGRRLAAEQVDTNNKVFKTGMVKLEDFWRKACADRVKFVVAGPMSHFTPQAVRQNRFMHKRFRLVRAWNDPSLQHWRDERIELWERIGPTDAPCVGTIAASDQPEPKRRGKR